MALFVINCWDKPGVLDERLKHRPDHVAYLKTQDAVIRVAGPQLDDHDPMVLVKPRMSTLPNTPRWTKGSPALNALAASRSSTSITNSEPHMWP